MMTLEFKPANRSALSIWLLTLLFMITSSMHISAQPTDVHSKTVKKVKKVKKEHKEHHNADFDAESEGVPSPHHPMHRIKQLLIPPHLVMRQMSELKFTATQRKQLQEFTKSAHAQRIDLRFKLEEVISKLEVMLSQEKLDEKSILTQADEMMKVETKMKRARLTFSLQVYTLLTPKQRQNVRQMMKNRERKTKRLRNKHRQKKMKNMRWRGAH